MNFCNPLDKLYIKGVKQFSDLQEYSKKSNISTLTPKTRTKQPFATVQECNTYTVNSASTFPTLNSN